MTKKILLLIVFVSIVFSQGRYERVNNGTRFDTKTGEIEYLIDGKWYTNERIEKLQKKQLIKFPLTQLKKIDASLKVPTEHFSSKYLGMPNLALLDQESYTPNYDIKVFVKNNSSWKVEEIDISIIIEDKIYNYTAYFHSNNDGLPQDLSISYIISKQQILRDEQDYKWHIKEVRGYDPTNPPKLSWWE